MSMLLSGHCGGRREGREYESAVFNFTVVIAIPLMDVGFLGAGQASAVTTVSRARSYVHG